MAPSQGVFTQLGISATVPVSNRFDFKSGSIRKIQTLINGNGLRGTLEEDISRVRTGPYRVNGAISFEPNAAELALLLPWILGANASGTTYALADTLQSRFITTDQVVKVPTHAGCGVDRAVFRATKGQPLGLQVDVVGQTEGGVATSTYAEGAPAAAGTFPSLTIDTATGPFVFTDLGLSVGGNTYNAEDFELEVSNNIDKDRFFNSLTLTALVKRERKIRFRTRLPYGDAAAVYGSGAAGAAVVATFTNGTVSVVFTMPAVAFPAEGPEIRGRNEIMLQIQGDAYHSSSTNSLTVTLDSTP